MLPPFILSILRAMLMKDRTILQRCTPRHPVADQAADYISKQETIAGGGGEKPIVTLVL